MQLPQIGDVILGKYTLTATLGQGGMGVVYAARDRDLGDVAIKFLLPAFGARPEVAQRFLLEAKAGRRLRTDRVARVYAVESAGDGMPFIVMELLDGRDVAAVLRDRGTFPVPEAVDIVLQACEAVCEAHGLRIVHRDLKPGNLFLAKTADGSLDVAPQVPRGVCRRSERGPGRIERGGARAEGGNRSTERPLSGHRGRQSAHRARRRANFAPRWALRGRLSAERARRRAFVARNSAKSRGRAARGAALLR